MNMLHGKVHTIESYYDGKVTNHTQEIEQSILTSKQTMFKDIIDCLSVVNRDETDKLNLEISKNLKGQWRIVKKWRV